jgi:hypothetical protein
MAMPKLKCFVIMPFHETYDAVYKELSAIIEGAVPGHELKCVWLKDVHAAGLITEDIVHSLNTAALCVAEVSEANPNVMWETGFAMALGRPTILLSRDTANLPFDLITHRVLFYSLTQPEGLRAHLAKAVRETLAKYEVRPREPARAASPVRRTIAVTGSMNADPAKVARRVETILEPFLAAGTQWMCGSVGVTDETALEYLAERGQNVAAVGFHRYDLSPRVREMVEEGRVGFVDASVESMPKGLQGPSEREVLFAARADLAIILWDGKSTGAKQLIDYFQAIGVNSLTAFI